MDIKNKIKKQILLNKRPIRLDAFIKKALFDNNGYYLNNKPIGRKNDFITSPEISQMFGEIIGLYLFYKWNTKLKSRFNLIELGPGNATLFKDIVNSTSNHENFLKLANINFIEINKKLIKIQKKNTANLNLQKINWRQSINFKSKVPSIIYSNEFFDCFPVRHFILKDDWLERFVNFSKEQNGFYFLNKVVRNLKLNSLLNMYTKEKILEVSFRRNQYFERICKFIKKNGGIFLTIDYGYFEAIKNFTLQGIQNHKFSNVLENVGSQDISSHVNFKDFINIAKNNKLHIEEYCSQREFLIKYGIFERAKFLSMSDNSKKIDQQLERLIDKEKMGDLFKCLIVSNL